MNDLLREWSESAKAWREHSATIRTMFTPLTRRLIEAAGISAAQSVLDVAGGPGEPSLTIAKAVGPTGSVTYTDAVAEMVATAEAEAHRRGVNNVEFRQCRRRIAAVCRQHVRRGRLRLGVMLFPDPPARVARDVACESSLTVAVCFVVWGNPERNPFTSWCRG